MGEVLPDVTYRLRRVVSRNSVPYQTRRSPVRTPNPTHPPRGVSECPETLVSREVSGL